MISKNIKLGGVRIDAISLEQVVSACCEEIKRKGVIRIAMINARKVKLAHEDEEVLTILNSAHISGADGVSLLIAAKLLRQPLSTGRVNGTDLMMKLLSASNTQGFRVFLFGATQSVLESCCDVIATDFPMSVVCGKRNGYDLSEHCEDEILQIKKAQTDIVLIALPSPAKERVAKRLEEVGAAHVIHGVGGSFDVLAGNISRAPVIWQRLGLEWLHRLIKEPTKMAPRVLDENLYLLKVVCRQFLGFEKQ
jgi:N-acetylglucosaminyldiphosphoundecaprenol N-acetyl-beta-D-mannosaminyltransferase